MLKRQTSVNAQTALVSNVSGSCAPKETLSMPNVPEILCSAKAVKTFGSLEQLQPPAVTCNFVSGSP